MATVRVHAVKSAVIALAKSNPPLILLTADGVVNTSGWTNPSLGLCVR